MKVVIIGGGESGIGAAILANSRNYQVFVSDFGMIEAEHKKVLDELGIRWEEGGHTYDEILSGNVIVKSPGISDKTEVIQTVLKAGLAVISEIEFAYAFNTELSVAITGSNGKTTTTMLTYHLLSNGGEDVGIGGNIGTSYAKQVAVNPNKCYVLELSSFQLDGINKFRPHIAVITNLSPDHLDRYDYNYENYINSKFRITLNQTKDDYLIYDYDDVEIQSWLTKNNVLAKKVPFSLNEKLEYGAYLEDENIVIAMSKETLVLPIDELGIEGKHNLKNAMAATAVAQLKRIRKQSIRESLSDFKAVEHRLEKVAKVDNVQYINDSKATNVNATFFALESVKTSIVWIVGGVDKGNDYDELLPFVHEKVKSIICLGVDNRKIKEAFDGVVENLIEVQTMADAVKMAQRLSESGDTVLLSPACASFDLFKSYEDRGRQFKSEVNNL